MGRDTATARDRNRRIRQEALREQLAAQGHEQHIVEILGKFMDESEVIQPEMVDRYKVVLQTKLQLLKKYIPDLAASHITTDNEGKSLEDWLDDLDTPKVEG